jgi:predicted secreted protein
MAKYGAYGAILKRGAVTVAQVRSISGPGLSLDTIDVTSHDSTGGWREFIAGLIDAGEVTAELIFDPDHASHVSLRTDLVARAATSYSVTFTDTTPQVWSASAFVTGLSPTAEVDGALVATATLKFTGAVTVT